MESAKKRGFGLGYSYVGYSFISFMFLAFVLVAFSNVVFPDVLALHPDDTTGLWNDTTLSTVNTICAVIASAAGIFIGQWVDKKGTKIVSTVGYFVGGANYLLFPFAARSFVPLCICVGVSHLAMTAFCQMTAVPLLAHWFNKKKGLTLGIAALGVPAANLSFLLLYSWLSENLGMTMALWIFALAHLTMGVVSIFWVHNTPAEVGLTPDNLPIEKDSGTIEDRSYKFSEVLSTPRVWLVMIISGLLNCTAIACTAQIVKYVVEKGVDSDTATLVVSLGALGGIVGGFLFSVLDQKLGPKKAIIIYTAVCVIVYAAMYFAAEGSIGLVVVLCMLAFALNGAPANLAPSLLLTIYGPESYNSISKVFTPVSSIFRACGYYVAAMFMSTIGGGESWTAVYIGIAVICAATLVMIIVCSDKPSSVRVKEGEENIFAMGETYFGFNQNFQGDIARIKELLYGRGVEGKFTSETIPEADIREVLEAGVMVPAGVNVKPTHFVAVSDPAVLDELRNMVYTEGENFATRLRQRFPGHPELKVEAHKFFDSLNSAPLAVLAFTDEPESDQFALAEDVKNVASAIQNMLLRAYDKGLGSYWLTSPIAAGIAPALKERFTDGQGEFISMVTFGYPDESHSRALEKKGYVEYI